MRTRLASLTPHILRCVRTEVPGEILLEGDAHLEFLIQPDGHVAWASVQSTLEQSGSRAENCIARIALQMEFPPGTNDSARRASHHFAFRADLDALEAQGFPRETDLERRCSSLAARALSLRGHTERGFVEGFGEASSCAREAGDLVLALALAQRGVEHGTRSPDWDVELSARLRLTGLQVESWNQMAVHRQIKTILYLCSNLKGSHPDLVAEAYDVLIKYYAWLGEEGAVHRYQELKAALVGG